MGQVIDDSLQVNGDLTANDTICAVGHPTGSKDYVIDVIGSTSTSQPQMVAALTVNNQPVGLDDLPGINTAVLSPNGTLKAKHTHNVGQDPAQWNTWADWVKATASGVDVVAVASSGIPAVPVPPQNGSAAALLQSVQLPLAWPVTCPVVLVFIQGHTGCPGFGTPLPTPPYPAGTTTVAEARISYYRLLNPFSGRVGIRTTQPAATLHVIADELSMGLRVSGKGGGDALSIDGSTELVGNLTVRAPAGSHIAEFSVLGGDVKLCITESGDVGIGTPAPSHKFHVVAPDAVGLFESSGGEAYLRLATNEGFDHRVEITNRPGGRFSVWTAGGGDQFNVTRDGNVGIGTISPQAKLHVQGDIIATGDIMLANADCAEEFNVKDSDALEPGTVMVLTEGDFVRPSIEAYDKKVVGVISGAGDLRPGILLDKQAQSMNRRPVALMGKVYCRCDAQYSAIEVGDLLTTSPTSGHAMKATDAARAFGAVIGKALRPHREGKGLIPVLIALQ